jgi:hypothetical protein
MPLAQNEWALPAGWSHEDWKQDGAFWRGIPDEERFWANVYPEPNSGCFIWGGSATDAGYGRLRLRSTGDRMSVTHFSLGLCGISVPDGKVVMHTCDFPVCVNPDHLIIGTQKENIEDCRKKGRRVGRLGYRQRRLVCIHGHRIEGDNVLIINGDKQRCRECVNKSKRESWARAKKHTK